MRRDPLFSIPYALLPFPICFIHYSHFLGDTKRSFVFPTLFPYYSGFLLGLARPTIREEKFQPTKMYATCMLP